MAAAPSRRSSFRTAEYWAALEVIADDLINQAASHTPHPSGDARGTLQRLSSRGFGPVSLFDLCALLILAAPGSPDERCGTGVQAPAIPPPTVSMSAAPVGDPSG
ncbi:hypothetical protein ACWFR4_48735, partial [Streptomyces sp. NPDC055140]